MHVTTNRCGHLYNKLCGRPPQYAPHLQVDILILKVVSESRVTWATSVPILVFLGLFVLDLCPMHGEEKLSSTCFFRGNFHRFGALILYIFEPITLKSGGRRCPSSC